MIKDKGLAFKLVFSILSSSTLIFLIIFGYNYAFSRRIIVRQIKENAEDLALLTVNKIETVLRPIEKVPQSLAFSLEQFSYQKKELLSLLRSAIDNNPEIYGGTIAFEPNLFEKDLLYFAPYIYKSDGEIKFTYLGSDAYKYFYRDWYQMPKELQKPVWSAPYYDEGGGNIMMSTYSVPFYRNIDGNRVFAGVVTADVSLSWLQDIVSSIKIADTGYGFLISNNGRIVTHPRKDLIMHETIFSLAELRKDDDLRYIGKKMIHGDSGFIPFKSIVTGKKCWMAYEPVPSSGWSLGVLFPQDELMSDIINLNRIVFALGALGFLFLLIVIVFISGTITKPLRMLARKTKDIAKGNLEFNLPLVKSDDEVGKLTRSFMYMREALKKYIKKLKETTVIKERMESELRIAHNIQMGIVPKLFPPFPQRAEFDIYAVLVPAKEVGGDLYDFFFIDDKHLCFVIGDVSGKGVPAALFMAVVKTLIKTIASEMISPEKILERVNKEIFAENDSCMFITVFCGILNTENGEVRYTNAGHNSPLIIQRNGEVKFIKGTGGTVVGVIEGAVFGRGKLTLVPDDVIYLYTDGVNEAFNENGEQFSEERLRDIIYVHRDDSAEKLVKNTLKEVKDYSKGVDQSDDITIMALKYFCSTKDIVEEINKKRFVLKNELSEIQTLARIVTGFGKKNNLSDEDINDINLSLEEVASNIITYGYDNSQRHRIVINLNLVKGELVIEVTDDARPFNPLDAPEPDIDKPLEERKIGGLGIYLVRKLMDKVEYKSEEGKNILIITKKVKKNDF